MIKLTLIHKPSGRVVTLNQTHANRWLDYSVKHGRGWELQDDAPKKKVTPKKKKDENTDSGASTGDS